jgi:hypothetical protein
VKVIVDEVASKAYVAIHEDPISTEVTHTLEKHGVLLHWDGHGKLMGVEFTSPDQNAPYVRYITHPEVCSLCRSCPGPTMPSLRPATETGAWPTTSSGRMTTRAELSGPGSVPRVRQQQASVVVVVLRLARSATTAGSTDAKEQRHRSPEATQPARPRHRAHRPV